MQLYFLGTGAGMPSAARNVSSLALIINGERNSTWLFDCGEGTQHQILYSPVKLSKLEFIFITHLHGDHIFGLPGLLSSRSNYGTETPITIFGPKGIQSFIFSALQVSETQLRYEINIVEWDQPEMGDILYEDSQFCIRLVPLEHRIASCGYRIEEKDRIGHLRVDLLENDGISAGPIYAKIKQQLEVELPDGRVIQSSKYLGPNVPGRIISIAGDSKICNGTTALLKNADVVVHEATFNEDYAHLASEYFHSTANQVAKIASENGTKKLFLTHLSARYNLELIKQMQDEVQSIFNNSIIVKDHDYFEI